MMSYFFKLVLVVDLILGFCLLVQGQNSDKGFIVGFNQISNDTLKSEISLFTKSGYAFKNTSIRLIAIPLRSCDGNTVVLEKGSFFSWDKSILIQTTAFDTSKHSLLFKDKEKKILERIDNHVFFGTQQTIPMLELKRVVCYFNEYNYVDFPLEGIYEPQLCLFTLNKKRKKKLVSNCKAFMSSDKKRIYVYMLNGVENNQYEVTWIIQNGKYFGRIIDRL